MERYCGGCGGENDEAAAAFHFLGTTQSLCPDCLAVVPAKIIVKGKRVYFRKRCDIHGVREDYVCSDVRLFDRNEHSTPGKIPRIHGTLPDRGCPYDCGLCTEHEQHTCIALLEITSNCNLTCPMCFAASAPGGQHLTFQQCKAAIDRLVAVEGKPEVLQLSGGEPTIHPEFLQILPVRLRAADRRGDDQYPTEFAWPRMPVFAKPWRGGVIARRCTCNSTV